MAIRRTTLQVTYEGADISADISANLIEFEYTDNAGDTSDEITLTLEDREQLWRDNWYPDKGAKLTVIIAPSDGPALPCGSFEIDAINISGPPSTVAISAIAVPITKPLRSEKRTRTWEGADLKKIGTEVASAAGLEFGWYGGEIPTYQRIDQHDESDLAFLSRLGKQLNHRVKVTDGRLVVWDESQYASKGPSISVDVNTAGLVTAYSFESKSADTYKACRVRWHDPVKKTDIEYTETSESVKTGQTLEINRRVESIDQARTMAKKELESANRFEVTATINMMGDSALSAGLVMEAIGSGKLSGKYLIDKARHRVSDGNGWTVSIDAHRVNE